MKITKRTIDKAINFLETIPKRSFIQGTFEYRGRYCAYGWLSRSINAPMSEKKAGEISLASERVLGRSIITINDYSEKGQIKATVINALCLIKENL